MINKKTDFIMCTLVAIFLSVITLHFQIKALGYEYINSGNQYLRHLAVLNGSAGSPWQYRVLSEWLIELYRYVTNQTGAAYYKVFVQFRFFQNICIFMLSWIWWAKLSISTSGRLTGAGLLAFAFTQALHDSDLSFNTYFDVMFYLMAAIFLAKEKLIYFFGVIFLASLNRETSGLMIFGPILSWWFMQTDKSLRKAVRETIIAAVIFAVLFIVLRIYYAPQHDVTAYGHTPGISMIKFNFLRLISYEQMFLTLGVTPLLALLNYKISPPRLKAWFWAVVPVWFLVHLTSAVAAETRLFLVPLGLVFIPMALIGVQDAK